MRKPREDETKTYTSYVRNNSRQAPTHEEDNDAQRSHANLIRLHRHRRPSGRAEGQAKRRALTNSTTQCYTTGGDA